MIFLTVGTQFPFDRLVKTVDEAIGLIPFHEEIFGQIGDSSYQPRNFEAVASLEKHQFDERIRQASGIISHAGVGSIMVAFDNVKPLLVMPRFRRYGEAVNDHQVDIARKFEQLGYLLAAYRVEELLEKMNALESFVPRKRETNAEAVLEQISKFLNALCNT